MRLAVAILAAVMVTAGLAFIAVRGPGPVAAPGRAAAVMYYPPG